MNPQDALDFANEVLAEHGLTEKGWKVKLDQAKRRLGVCKYRTKTIGLSEPYLRANNEAVALDTILHEVAHALAGPAARHGWEWKQWAVKLGARPKACAAATGLVQPKGRYQLVCTGCQTETQRHQLTAALRRNVKHGFLRCRRCRSTRFEVRENGRVVVAQHAEPEPVPVKTVAALAQRPAPAQAPRTKAELVLHFFQVYGGTRKQAAEFAGCTVSRVGEVIRANQDRIAKDGTTYRLRK